MAIETVGVTFGFTIMLVVFDVAVLLVKQLPPVIVISQLTSSLLLSEEVLKVFDALFCTLTLFTLKLYATVPLPAPEAVAVNVTLAPAQVGFVPAVMAMLTDGVILPAIIMVMVLEVAVLLVKQVPPVTVISQVTSSPSASEEVVKVLEAVFCILAPFTLKL